jgi:hypothetical protein
LTAAALAVVFLPVAQKVIVGVLQQPVNSKVHTKCNIWYQNRKNVQRNIQKGSSFRSAEIEIVSASESKIVFKDMHGIQYRSSLMIR